MLRERCIQNANVQRKRQETGATDQGARKFTNNNGTSINLETQKIYFVKKIKRYIQETVVNYKIGCAHMW